MFDQLPTDVCVMILSHLHPSDLSSFSKICRSNHALFHNPHLWRALSLRDQSNPVGTIDSYKTVHAQTFLGSFRLRKYKQGTKKVVAATNKNYVRAFADLRVGTSGRFNNDHGSSWRFMCPSLNETNKVLMDFVIPVEPCEQGLKFTVRHWNGSCPERKGIAKIDIILNGNVIVQAGAVENSSPQNWDFLLEKKNLKRGLNSIEIRYLENSTAQYCFQDVNIVPAL